MIHSRPPARPSFLWQAGLILLPVVVLTFLGAFSLRQDRALVQQEAAVRAQELADRLVQDLASEWKRISLDVPGASDQMAFAVDRQGRLAFPPACEVVPPPQILDPAGLNPNSEVAR